MPTLISPRSWGDEAGATITTDSEVEGLGVRSLLTTMLAEIWRLGPGPDHTLDLTLAGPRAVRCVVLYAPRDGVLPDGATITASLSDTALGGTDSGTIAAPLAMPRGYWCWVLPETVAARYLRLVISSGAEPYLQFGRLWAGDALVSNGFWSEGEFDPGVVDTVSEPTRRRFQLALSSLLLPQADALEGIGLNAGTQKQLLVIPRIDRADRSAVFGKLTNIPAPQPRRAWSEDGQLYSATIAIQEDR
jgi:hypothetical protein